MKIFLDTANIESIKRYNDMGVVDGITTNPTLLSREKGHPEEIMREITRLVNGPVNLEVVGITANAMIEEGSRLKQFGDNVVVKIPMTPDGLKAVRILNEEGNKNKRYINFFIKSSVACSQGRSIIC